jgi:di/tricarboxylate transporter
MVYAPGRYRFLDFFRFGWPLSLAYTLMLPLPLPLPLLLWFA